MKNQGRYNTKGSDQGECEPGSNDLVLKNRLSIADLKIIEKYESEQLANVTEEYINQFTSLHQFTANDLCNFHRSWLGGLYSWAGEYRTVNMSKGGFTFAAAHLLPQLMDDFEKKILVKYTPYVFDSIEKVVHVLAVVHFELVLIHPFREGNGRLARLLSSFMALQANLPPLNFSGIKGHLQEEYFVAVRAGLDIDYKPMEVIFQKVLEQSQ